MIPVFFLPLSERCYFLDVGTRRRQCHTGALCSERLGVVNELNTMATFLKTYSSSSCNALVFPEDNAVENALGSSIYIH